MSDILARAQAHRDRPPKSTGRRLTVANVILTQMGDGKFIAMTGAKDMVGDATSLTFKLPARTSKDGVNAVKVALDPSDTYTMTFYAIGRGAKVETVRKVSGLFGDQLQAVFTAITGLYTRL